MIKKIEKEGGAILVFGPKGVGKYTMVKERIAALLPEDKLSVHPDFLEIKKSKASIGIDEVVKIQQFLNILPVKAGIRVVLVDDASDMTEAAQNALLKVLEDKTDNALIYLICHDKMLPTIESRCQNITVSKLGTAEMESILDKLGVKKDDLCMELSDGRPGLYLEMIKESDYLASVKKIEEVLRGQAEKRDLFEAIGTLKERDKGMFFERFPKEFTESMFTYLANMLWMEYVPTTFGKEWVLPIKRDEALEVMKKLLEQSNEVKRGQFNKNDFFNVLVYLSERINAATA